MRLEQEQISSSDREATPSHNSHTLNTTSILFQNLPGYSSEFQIYQGKKKKKGTDGETAVNISTFFPILQILMDSSEVLSGRTDYQLPTQEQPSGNM